MSDHTEENELTPYREQVIYGLSEVAANPQATYEAIYKALETVYLEAKKRQNEGGMAFAEQVLGDAKALLEAQQQTVTIAATAMQLAQTYKAQSEETTEALVNKIQAMRDMDNDDADVNRLVTDARSLEYDVIHSNGYHTDDPTYDILKVAKIPLTPSDARDFFSWLTSAQYSTRGGLNPDERQSLADLITTFVEQVKDRQRHDRDMMEADLVKARQHGAGWAVAPARVGA